jgi:hypothetical protein
MNEGKINNAPKIPIVYTNASAIDSGGNKSQPAFVFKNTESGFYTEKNTISFVVNGEDNIKFNEDYTEIINPMVINEKVFENINISEKQGLLFKKPNSDGLIWKTNNNEIDLIDLNDTQIIKDCDVGDIICADMNDEKVKKLVSYNILHPIELGTNIIYKYYNEESNLSFICTEDCNLNYGSFIRKLKLNMKIILCAGAKISSNVFVIFIKFDNQIFPSCFVIKANGEILFINEIIINKNTTNFNCIYDEITNHILFIYQDQTNIKSIIFNYNDEHQNIIEISNRILFSLIDNTLNSSDNFNTIKITQLLTSLLITAGNKQMIIHYPIFGDTIIDNDATKIIDVAFDMSRSTLVYVAENLIGTTYVCLAEISDTNIKVINKRDIYQINNVIELFYNPMIKRYVIFYINRNNQLNYLYLLLDNNIFEIYANICTNFISGIDKQKMKNQNWIEYTPFLNEYNYRLELYNTQNVPLISKTQINNRLRNMTMRNNTINTINKQFVILTWITDNKMYSGIMDITKNIKDYIGIIDHQKRLILRGQVYKSHVIVKTGTRYYVNISALEKIYPENITNEPFGNILLGIAIDPTHILLSGYN